MFSDRLLLLIEVILNIGRAFGSCVLCLDHKRRIYYNTTEVKTYKLLKRNFCLCWAWFILSLAVLRKYYVNGDITRYNISLTIWFGLLMLLCVYSGYYLCYRDIGYAATGAVKFFVDIQGNGLLIFSILVYKIKARNIFSL